MNKLILLCMLGLVVAAVADSDREEEDIASDEIASDEIDVEESRSIYRSGSGSGSGSSSTKMKKKSRTTPKKSVKTYSGSKCSQCPFKTTRARNARGVEYTPTSWGGGATVACAVPKGAKLVKGTTLCYCHGRTADGADCRRFGNQWFKDYRTGKYAGVKFSFSLEVTVKEEEQEEEEEEQESESTQGGTKFSGNVIKSQPACDVSSEIHTALLKFQKSAASTLAEAQQSLKQRQIEYKEAKDVAIKATQVHNKAKAARTLAENNSATCDGQEQAIRKEWSVQKPLIDNELQCVTALRTVVDRLSDTKIQDLEEMKPYRDTDTYKQAATVLMEEERSTGASGSAVKSIRALLDKLEKKLRAEMAALKKKMEQKIAECVVLKGKMEDARAAASVANNAQIKAEKELALAAKRVAVASAHLASVTDDRATETTVIGNIRARTNSVCEGKRLTTSKYNVCNMKTAVEKLFQTRHVEHTRHTRNLAGYRATERQAKADIGPATTKRDQTKEASRAATAASVSCQAALRVAESNNEKYSNVIARELKLVDLLRNKAGCLTKASREKRTDCSVAQAALTELQEKNAVAGLATTLMQLSRGHDEVESIIKLLKTLEDALIKERDAYALALQQQQAKCKKATAAAKLALEQYRGAQAVLKQTIADYVKAKKVADDYAAVVRRFNEERETEEKRMKSAMTHMIRFAKTKFGKKWAACKKRNCWLDLPCPAGQTRYGDGSACRGGGKLTCDLGYCAKSPNGGMKSCPKMQDEKVKKHAVQ